MQKKWIVAALIFVGATLILLHQPILQGLEALFSPRDTRSVIGNIEDVYGEADVRLPESMEAVAVKKGQPIRHQDTLTTGPNSRLILRLKSGLALELEPQSSLFFEQSDTTLITFQRGNFKVIEKGAGVHDVVILKDGILQDPEGRTIPPSQLLKTDIAESEDQPLPTMAPPPEETKTLSDAYISSVIQNQKGFLNRCYAQHLRSNPHSRGDLQLTFTIQPNGDVTNLKILKSSITDGELQKCVLSVIERSRFRAFQSEAIVVNYPIYFE
jgi:TonB family protein